MAQKADWADERAGNLDEEVIHKKTVSACILNILEQKSGPDYRLSVKDIVELLPEYSCTAQRKAVSDYFVRLCKVLANLPIGRSAIRKPAGNIRGGRTTTWTSSRSCKRASWTC